MRMTQAGAVLPLAPPGTVRGLAGSDASFCLTGMFAPMCL